VRRRARSDRRRELVRSAAFALREDALDQRRIFDAGHDTEPSAAALTGFDVDSKIPKCEAPARSGASAATRAPRPRPAGVTAARSALAGANTP
jgi:hypothetical protein